MASAIAAALDRTTDRQYLMRRGLEHTATRAAARFLEVVDELLPSSVAGRAIALADAP
jgi:hypothetical protein